MWTLIDLCAFVRQPGQAANKDQAMFPAMFAIFIIANHGNKSIGIECYLRHFLLTAIACELL